jgi:hypothetical protein
MQSLSQLMQIGRGCKEDVASAPTTTMLFLTRDEETARHFLRASAGYRVTRRSRSMQGWRLFGYEEHEATGRAVEAKTARRVLTTCTPRTCPPGKWKSLSDDDIHPAGSRPKQFNVISLRKNMGLWRELSRVLATERRLSFDLGCRHFHLSWHFTSVGLTGLVVGCESPNKLAVACGVGWVGIVEGAGTTGLSVGFSAFFFRPSAFFCADLKSSPRWRSAATAGVLKGRINGG